MPETDAKRAQHCTVALFVASAVLAAVGVTLLLGTDNGEHPNGAAPAPTQATATSLPGKPRPGVPAAASSSLPKTSPQPTTLHRQRLLPQPIQKAARTFVTAWASHDARPGKDKSYDDASRRAANYAAGGIARDLRTRVSGSAAARQWRDWKAAEVRVSATVRHVSLPDGAPAPTRESGFARVLYKVIEKPAAGPPVESDQQVALQLYRSSGGGWRVVGLPDA